MRATEAAAIKNEAIARLAQAFTNPVRLAIVGLLAQGEASVDTIARKTGQSRANASAQLKVLLEADLALSRREGRHVYYRLAGPPVRRLWRALQDVAAEQNPALRELVRDWLGEPVPLDRKSARELRREVEAGKVTLVDLRPADEYSACHIPGALSLPAEELPHRVDELPKRKEIVAYCRGPWCADAAEGVRLIESTGRRVRNLYAGTPDWTALGLATEATED